MQIAVPSLHVVEIAVAASLFVMVSRLSVVPLLYVLGMGHRASLLPAINLAQVSEFSIVIASLGLMQQPRQIDSDVVTIVIMTFAITAVVSTYMIQSSHRVQKTLSGLLKVFRVRDLDVGDAAPERKEARSETMVFLGFFRDASSILLELESDGSAVEGQLMLDKILVIDFNPTVMRELRKRGVSCVYGDIAHADTLRHAGIENAELVVSSITDDVLRGTSNLRLLRNARSSCPKARVMLTTEHIPQALHFYRAGADFVYIPRLHSAVQIARILKQGLNGGFDAAREAEIKHLSHRREVLA
jgi:hypothetical protein